MTAVTHAGWVVMMMSLLVSHAEPSVESVRRAIDLMDQHQVSDWAFLTTIQTRDRVIVVRHDPRLSGARRGWRLESVDGEAPSRRDLEAFERELDRHESALADEGNPPQTIARLVPVETLRLHGERDGLTALRFDPRLPSLPGDVQGRFAGELVFDPFTDRIESVSVRTVAPYSPSFAVRIHAFELDIGFEPHEGRTVVTSIEASLEGRFLLVKPINETVQVEFSEYQWIGVASDQR